MAVLETTACLIAHDRNRHGVDAKAAGRMALVRVYADRVTVLLGEGIVADHPRSFTRGQVVYDHWHDLPALLRKPGASRNGAPFKDWDLPAPLSAFRSRLQAGLTFNEKRGRRCKAHGQRWFTLPSEIPTSNFFGDAMELV